MGCVQNKTWQNKRSVKMTITGHTKNYSCYFDCDCGWMNCVEVRGQLALANSSFHHVRPEDQTQVINRVDN